MGFRHGDIVEIIYIDQAENLSQRHIQVITQREKMILAYCFTKRQIRSFVLQNILAIKKVKVA